MDHDPLSQTEVQALRALQAARDVAACLEAGRRRARDEGASPVERRAARAEVIEAAERLCNLVDLVSFWCGRVSPEVSAGLRTALDELRAKFHAVGARLVSDRLDAMERLYGPMAAGRAPFPLGLSERYRAAMHRVDSVVQGLGGADTLPAEARDKLAAAARLGAQVAALERRVGSFEDFGQPPNNC